MAKTGHLYAYDANQNATFPAQITATQFNGALSGNASTATKATQDESGNNIKATYGSSLSISGHTIKLTNKNGSELASATISSASKDMHFYSGTSAPSDTSGQTV